MISSEVQKGSEIIDSILLDFALGETTGHNEKEVLERYFNGKVVVPEEKWAEIKEAIEDSYLCSTCKYVHWACVEDCDILKNNAKLKELVRDGCVSRVV